MSTVLILSIMSLNMSHRERVAAEQGGVGGTG